VSGPERTGTGVTNSHWALDHLTRPRAMLVEEPINTSAH
jgi:hypothetical protein